MWRLTDVYGQHFHQSLDQLPTLFVVSWTGKLIFPCPRPRLRIWSRETGSAVPTRVNPLILHTQAESDWLVLTHGIPPASRDGVHLSIPPTAIGSVLSLSSTQLRTDGVHRQESAGTGPVVLEVVRVTDDALQVLPQANLCAPLFLHTHYWYNGHTRQKKYRAVVGGCQERTGPRVLKGLMATAVLQYF